MLISIAAGSQMKQKLSNTQLRKGTLQTLGKSFKKTIKIVEKTRKKIRHFKGELIQRLQNSSKIFKIMDG